MHFFLNYSKCGNICDKKQNFFSRIGNSTLFFSNFGTSKLWHFYGFPPPAGSRSILDDGESPRTLNRHSRCDFNTFLTPLRVLLISFLWELQLIQPVQSSTQRRFFKSESLSKLSWDLIILRGRETRNSCRKHWKENFESVLNFQSREFS